MSTTSSGIGPQTSPQATGYSALPEGGSALGRQDFLQLLVTQLRNQDPMDPQNDREFLAQMAQLSALEATQQMSARLDDTLAAQRQGQALQAIGREIDYTDAAGALRQGTVSAALLHETEPLLLVDGQQVALSAVRTVRDKKPGS